VAKGEGRHTFSETYEAHLGAVRSGNRPPSLADGAARKPPAPNESDAKP
jgi:hypothetical protein